jgi:hypothetical protein
MLMAVSQNVGVPLALAFGVAETAEFYEQLYHERTIQMEIQRCSLAWEMASSETFI